VLVIVITVSDITATISYMCAFTSKDVFLFLDDSMNSFNLQGRRFSQRSSSAKSTRLLDPQREGANVYKIVDNFYQSTRCNAGDFNFNSRFFNSDIPSPVGCNIYLN